MKFKKYAENYEPEKDLKTVRNQALNYLHAHYEDSFTVQSATTINWAENYETLIVSSEKYSGKTFFVRRIYENTAITFTDNYFTLYMVADANQYVKRIADRISLNAEIRVDFTEGELPKTLKTNACFQDYLNMGGSPFCYITLMTPKELKREDQLSFMKILAEEKFQCNVIFQSHSSCHHYGVDSNDDIRDYH
ncbi:hypothetical protein VSQ48_15825 [Candidatus Ventrimonas sp. KK005]|nr:hypothetical protein [Lachnospiraceae bacterium]NBH18878.1 hypothetical protein [Clostridiaceae bacterium]